MKSKTSKPMHPKWWDEVRVHLRFPADFAWAFQGLCYAAAYLQVKSQELMENENADPRMRLQLRNAASWVSEVADQMRTGQDWGRRKEDE